MPTYRRVRRQVNPADAEPPARKVHCTAMRQPTNPRIGVYWALLLWLLWAAVAPSVAADREGVNFPEYIGGDEGGEFNYDSDLDTPWIENEAKVLAAPRPEDLTPVEIDSLPAGLTLRIDMSRIGFDPKDRVIRVWLSVSSPGGADNSSFEGFRCSTREYKVYAHANPRRDPPVGKVKRPLWRSVETRARINYRQELMNDYFCGIRGARNAREIRDVMTGAFEPEAFVSD